MSVKVNPPPQVKIPDKFLNDLEIRPFFEKQRTIMFQLWQRTGGANDAVSGRKEITSISASIELDSSAYGTLIVVNADTSAVEITLPVPDLGFFGETIEIVINDATFNTTITPSTGCTIIGQANLAMNRQYQSYPLTAISTTEWVIAGD